MSTFAGYENVFTVTNRRLGIIDLTVTKTWVDGDNSETELLMDALKANNLALALYLKFDPDFVPEDNEYKIDYVNNTITLGNEVVDIRDNTGKKGDRQGHPAHHAGPGCGGKKPNTTSSTCPSTTSMARLCAIPWRRSWWKLDADGNVTDNAVTDSLSDYPYTDETTGEEYTLQELWNWYTRSYDKSDYNVAEKHERDTHAIQVTNSLVGAKNVQWHKQWADRYAYETGGPPGYLPQHLRLGGTPDRPDAENTPPRLVYEKLPLDAEQGLSG